MSPVDGLYGAVATLTTSSVADGDLVLDDPWLEVFTAFCSLVGIGIVACSGVASASRSSR